MSPAESGRPRLIPELGDRSPSSPVLRFITFRKHHQFLLLVFSSRMGVWANLRGPDSCLYLNPTHPGSPFSLCNPQRGRGPKGNGLLGLRSQHFQAELCPIHSGLREGQKPKAQLASVMSRHSAPPRSVSERVRVCAHGRAGARSPDRDSPICKRHRKQGTGFVYQKHTYSTEPRKKAKLAYTRFTVPPATGTPQIAAQRTLSVP